MILPFRLCLLACTAPALCGAAASAGTTVAWNIENGWLVACDGEQTLLTAAPLRAVDAIVDDRPLLAGENVQPEVDPDTTRGFTVHYRTQRGVLSDQYVPFPPLGQHAWLRTAVYTNTSTAPQDLLRVDMRLAPATVLEPRWRTRDFWMGQVIAARAVCISYRGESDHYELDEEASGWPVHRVHACWRLSPGQSARIGRQGIWLGEPGREPFREEARRWYGAIGLGTTADVPGWLRGAILYQVSAGGHVDARFSNGGGFDSLASQTDYLADLGITAVWLQAVHEHKSSPDPMRGGWNCYAPRDFSRIDPILGGVDGFQRLCAALRGRGLHILGEIVPHGGQSVQAQQLPDWWTRGRDGEPLRNWGGFGMDYASPPWQAVMRGAAAQLAREGGVVGLRVDVADGSGPHWGSPRTVQASLSGLGGAVELLTELSHGLRDGGAPHSVLIPEAPNTVEFFSVAPVGYDHHGWFMMGRDMPPLIRNPSAMRDHLREYFENTRGTLPPGALVLRTLNNHDTVVESGRVHYRYGVGLARALYGVCLMVEGIPMMYQEEEKGSYEAIRRLNWARRSIPEFSSGTPDYLSIDFAPEVFSSLRVADHGSAVGLSNLAGAMVAGDVVLPQALGVPDGTHVYDGVSGCTAVVRDGTFRWQLAPYETALIRVGQRPSSLEPTSAPAAPPTEAPRPAIPQWRLDEGVLRLHHGELSASLSLGADAWQAVEPAGQYECDSGRAIIEPLAPAAWRVTVQANTPVRTPELVVFQARQWRVSGRTALLADRVVRRTYPFPPEANYAWDRTMAWGRGPYGAPYHGVAPVGRLWESVLEPLHPDRGALAWVDQHGLAFLVSDIDTSAAHLVLTDRTDEQPQAPYGMSLRFHAQDPDLAPTIARLGLGHPLMVDHPIPVEDPPCHVSFHVRATDERTVDERLTAHRMPVDRGECTVRVEGPEVRRQGDSIWFVQPGAAVWEHLRTIPGRYRLQFELRHSEASETGTDQMDAYRLEIDGRDIPFRWTRQNTYRTGNAYFGQVLTDPIDFESHVSTMRLVATRTWAAMRGRFHLIPCE